MEDLEKIIDLGFDRILTSGLQSTAIQGQLLLKQLIEQANDRIIILPGSGINSQNIVDFLRTTNAKEIHASAKKIVTPLKTHLFTAPYYETDQAEVEQLMLLLQQFDQKIG